MDLSEDFAREAAFWEGVEFCDLLVRILNESRGEKWADAEAQVSEHHPHLDAYQTLIQVKRLLILEHPDGGEAVWQRLVSALDADHKPHT